MKPPAILFLILILVQTSVGSLGQGADSDEFIGPLPSWLNAKTGFGAVGDGGADDTAALQKALDALVAANGKATALYLPKGHYRITRTLTLPRKAGREAIGLTIEGEDPERTVILWDGPEGGAMLDYGAWYSRLGRITFEGAGRAGTGIRHGPDFVTANELTDLRFRDMGFGIEAGDMRKAGIAETSVQRCAFQDCSKAGISIQNFNTLDWWIWHCRFDHCRLGVTNAFGAGNFHVYGSLFQGSTDSDISIGNTGYFSVRGNVSADSKSFFVAAGIRASAELTFQGNGVMLTDAARPAIRVGNLGPVFLLDNSFVTEEGGPGPIAEGPNAWVISAGNTFDIANPLRF